MKTIIIGGVAGGATAAARLRRLDEKAEIIILERGEYVSFANCGLPYYIGGDLTVLQDDGISVDRLNTVIQVQINAFGFDIAVNVCRHIKVEGRDQMVGKLDDGDL